VPGHRNIRLLCVRRRLRAGPGLAIHDDPRLGDAPTAQFQSLKLTLT
jgi:hypothetical protein